MSPGQVTGILRVKLRVASYCVLLRRALNNYLVTVADVEVDLDSEASARCRAPFADTMVALDDEALARSLEDVGENNRWWGEP